MSDIYDYFEEGFPHVLSVYDEWLDEIYQLHEFIKAIGLPGYKIQQVKEKFGGLRFYCSFDYEGEWNTMYGSLEDNIKTAEGAIRYVEWKLQ